MAHGGKAVYSQEIQTPLQQDSVHALPHVVFVHLKELKLIKQ
jgi:hypothetical protein